MTTFEIIILAIIYLFGYGYTVKIFMKEDNIYLTIIFSILSFVIAIYFPMFLAGDLYKRINKE